MKNWIKRVQKRYIFENVAKVWRDYDLNKDNKISWDEYKQATYGYYLGEKSFEDVNVNKYSSTILQIISIYMCYPGFLSCLLFLAKLLVPYCPIPARRTRSKKRSSKSAYTGFLGTKKI